MSERLDAKLMSPRWCLFRAGLLIPQFQIIITVLFLSYLIHLIIISQIRSIACWQACCRLFASIFCFHWSQVLWDEHFAFWHFDWFRTDGSLGISDPVYIGNLSLRTSGPLQRDALGKSVLARQMRFDKQRPLYLPPPELSDRSRGGESPGGFGVPLPRKY
jgi:hypothetical protein